MGRILVVDDDDAICQLVSDLLRPKESETYTDASIALEKLQANPDNYDLIITDINMPGVDGFQFRDRIRDDERLASIPFIFLTAADQSVERELASRMPGEIVQFKPVNVPGLRRIVASLLGELERSDGPFTADDLTALLSSLHREETTAVATFYKRDVIKKVYFEDGHLTFAISNDPKELVGQALIRHGLVSEGGLAKLFAARGDRTIPLGEIVIARAAASAADLRDILESKIKDAVLELFLWDWGWHEVYFGGVDKVSEVPFAARLPLERIVAEGSKRAAIWRRITPKLPAAQSAFTVHDIPESELVTTGDRLVAQLLKDGRSLAQLRLELRGQEYAIGIKIARWLDQGFIEPTQANPSSLTPSRAMDEAFDSEVDDADDGMFGGPTPTPPRAPAASTPVAPLLGQALVLFRSGKLHEARDRFMEALQLDPSNPLARKRLQEIDEKLIADAATQGLVPDTRLVFIGSMEDLPDRPLSFSETFVLSRLAEESMTVEALTQICPISEAELMRILVRLVDDGILRIA